MHCNASTLSVILGAAAGCIQIKITASYETRAVSPPNKTSPTPLSGSPGLPGCCGPFIRLQMLPSILFISVDILLCVLLFWDRLEDWDWDRAPCLCC